MHRFLPRPCDGRFGRARAVELLAVVRADLAREPSPRAAAHARVLDAHRRQPRLAAVQQRERRGATVQAGSCAHRGDSDGRYGAGER